MSSENETLQVTIDLMKKDDLSDILAIERTAFASPWTEGMFLAELKTTHSQCLVVRIHTGEESIIGAYIIFWLVAGEIHLHNLAVKNEIRRQKLGYNLLGIMKDIGRQAGAHSQTLEVRESNIAAINLYRKCGFVVKGRRPLYYTDTYEDALIMWADIN